MVQRLLEIFIYYSIHLLFRLGTQIFFREILTRGSHQIPKKGPVIFVAAPHANQFVDPLVVMQTCPRSLKFLMAASSLRKGAPGFFGRLLGCIPVERSMDLAQSGVGRVYCQGQAEDAEPDESHLIIKGIGTKFTKQFVPNQSSLAIQVPPDVISSVVQEVLSDTELKLKKPLEAIAYRQLESPEGCTFKVLPVVDQSDVYNSVFEVLERGECIGIFPEGGSHDRAEMLPLKAGVTIMALGTMARNPDLEVTIVPCGLNYFNPDKFRSRAIVEFGEPLRVDRKLVELFKGGGDQRREACGRLLDEIYYSLCSVTINVPDFETLQLVQATRRLYQPSSKKLSSFELLEITRRFVKGYLAFKDQPRVKKLLQGILEYNKILRNFHLFDHQVRTFQLSRLRAFLYLITRLFLVLLYGVTILPALILNLPAMLLIRSISRKKAERAVASSVVKLQGRDVLATWKLMVGFVLFPLLYLIYSTPVAIRMWQSGFRLSRILATVLSLTCIIFPSLSFLFVKIAERGYETYYSIRPLWYSVTRPHYSEVIRNLRHRLKLEIVKTVDEYGPQLLLNFEHTRIVPSRRPSMPHNTFAEDATGQGGGDPLSPDLPPQSTMSSSVLPALPVSVGSRASPSPSPSPLELETIAENDDMETVLDKAKSISRESSPSNVAPYEGLDSVMAGFQYMRAGVQAALLTASFLSSNASATGGVEEQQEKLLRVEDWSYVDPIEIDDIFFTKATSSPTSDQERKQQ